MNFIYPGFLIALLALAIPILIHLFYFRRYKRVYFSNVAFLKEVQQESKSRRRLRNILVLLARLMALGLLVLAFAMPFFDKSETDVQAPKAVSIFVDNSFSMEALSQEVPLIDMAKARARQIINAYSSTDKFQILTHDLEGRHQHVVGQEEALALLDEVQPTAAVHSLSKVLNMQRNALQQVSGSQTVLYQISDFQQNISDIQDYQDTTFPLRLVPLKAVQQRNISIDSAWFEAPVPMLNQSNMLMVQLSNYSPDRAENRQLSLLHEGQEKPIGNFSIDAGQTLIDTVNISLLRTGWHQAQLRISDYPITFDDVYNIAFEVPDEVDILVINEDAPQPYVSAAMSGATAYQVTQRSYLELDYSAFPKYQLILVNELAEISSGLASELWQFMEGGGNVLVFPSPDANVNSYNAFLQNGTDHRLESFDKAQNRVTSVNIQEFVFNDVYENTGQNLLLPTTAGRYALRNQNRGETLLRYRDGKSMMEKIRHGSGNLYLCAAPLSPEYSDLVRQAEVFVPMIYKMAISTGERKRISYTIGQDENLRTDASDVGAEASMRLRSDEQEFIPLVRKLGKSVILSLQGGIRKAGFYELVQSTGSEPLEVFAFNNDRTESSFRFYNSDELSERMGAAVNIIDGNTPTDLTPIIGQQNKGAQWWRWCLWGALLFLLIEVLLLRFWKV